MIASFVTGAFPRRSTSSLDTSLFGLSFFGPGRSWEPLQHSLYSGARLHSRTC